MTVGCAIFLLARGWSTAMGGTPSDNRASDFSTDISLLGLTPYARHGFFYTDGFLLWKTVYSSVLIPSIFQVATKALVMDAHRVTLKDGSPSGS